MARPKNFKKPVGRPKMPRGEARGTVVTVNVTAKTAKKLKDLARLNGYHTRSAYLADLLLETAEG
jgi:hypothetical protein